MEKKSGGKKKDGSKNKPNLSKNKLLKEMVLVTSKNHRNETLKNLIQKIQFNEVIIMGSIGCKITSIVKGESDIYISLSLPGKVLQKIGILLLHSYFESSWRSNNKFR